jgi:hypothetical protein
MQGIEWEGPEDAFRRGYEHAAIEMFHAVSRFLVPAAREILPNLGRGRHLRMAAQFDARLSATWRFRMLAGAGLPGGISDLCASTPLQTRASPPVPPGS